jgi:hypothetical protein
MTESDPTRKPPVLRRPPSEDADLPRLMALGQVYVTLTAAEQYARQRGLRIEEARRELTELLLDARVQDETSPMRVRARSRLTQIDVSARVSREGRLLVVVSLDSKDYLR